MSRLLLLLIAGGVIVAGIAGFVLLRPGSTPQSAEQASVTTSPTESALPTTGSTSMTMQELFAQGGDRKCTWSGDMGGQTMNGTVYISGQKVRSEAKGTMPAIGPFTAYVVGDGTTLTIWTSLAPSQKTAMAYADIDRPSPTGQAAFNQFAQRYNFQCSSWTPDQSLFIVPR